MPPPDDPFGRSLVRYFGVMPGNPIENSTEPGVVQGKVGSPGVVRGRAKVVRLLSEAAKVELGDILIAETTTPPWTPLFATVAAVVTDVGGILSN